MPLVAPPRTERDPEGLSHGSSSYSPIGDTGKPTLCMFGRGPMLGSEGVACKVASPTVATMCDPVAPQGGRVRSHSWTPRGSDGLSRPSESTWTPVQHPPALVDSMSTNTMAEPMGESLVTMEGVEASYARGSDPTSMAIVGIGDRLVFEGRVFCRQAEGRLVPIVIEREDRRGSKRTYLTLLQPAHNNMEEMPPLPPCSGAHYVVAMLRLSSHEPALSKEWTSPTSRPSQRPIDEMLPLMRRTLTLHMFRHRTDLTHRF